MRSFAIPNGRPAPTLPHTTLLILNEIARLQALEALPHEPHVLTSQHMHQSNKVALTRFANWLGIESSIFDGCLSLPKLALELESLHFKQD